MMKLYNFDFVKKLLYHPERIVALKNGHKPFPVTLEIDLTNRCNHRCSFCYVIKTFGLNKAQLEKDLVIKCIKEASDLGTRGIVFTGGGEPLLHQDFIDILKYTADLGLDCGLITNGSLINDNMISALNDYLTWIRISMGGMDAHSYKEIQGVDHFDRVMHALFMLQDDKSKRHKTINIGIRVMLNKLNIEHLSTFCESIKTYNINYLQLAHDSFDVESGKELERTNQDNLNTAGALLEGNNIMFLTDGYTTHQQQDEDLGYIKKCYAHHFITSLMATGDLIFCKNSKEDSRFYIGNVRDKSLEEIWTGEKCRYLQDTISPSSCGLFCKNLGTNKALQEVITPTADMSPNFMS